MHSMEAPVQTGLPREKSYCADGSSYCQRRVRRQMIAPTASEIAAAAKLNLLRVKNSATEIRVPRMGTTKPGVRKPSLSLRRRGTAAHVKRYVLRRATADSMANCANDPTSAKTVAT